MRIKGINKSKHQLPLYFIQESGGIDLRANPGNDIILKPLERILIPNELFMEIPVGYKAQIRTRRCLAIKKGITILNSPGTIDAGYREEICIILLNSSNEKFVIEDGERICQMIIAKNKKARLKTIDILLDSERGVGGFGHTGKN
jgi:deoxyuridine 5''-triphosphate nucleotidohydrolase (dut)